MYEMDKQKFGAFVASLRKERGYTQKELAGMLYVSNKAVSKWETGVSILDITLLVPLSEALGVSVTALLKCQRLPSNSPMDSVQVESLVKTAISYSEEQPKRDIKRRNIIAYCFCAAASLGEMSLLYFREHTQFSESLLAAVLLSILLGFYFMIAAKTTLPDYYDSNHITTYNDGPVRMNLGAMRISNRNWPHIVKVYRWWSMLLLVGYPLLSILMLEYVPSFWLEYEKLFLLISIVGGMLIPVMIVGRKYQ